MSNYASSADIELQQSVFRNFMAAVATPVSVVTALKDGRAYGTTVSAFASLSMNPPMTMVALDRGSDLLSALRQTGEFGLNILGKEHLQWASVFAKKGNYKFSGIPWEVDMGLPRLSGTCWAVCSVESLVDGGDHVIALGAVLKTEVTGGKPLIYHQRTFCTLAPVPGGV